MSSQKIKLMMAPKVWKALQVSTRVSALDGKVPLDRGPLIFACLHRDMIASILFVKPAKPWLLVSGSDDGALLVKALDKKFYSFITGATGENGGRALVRLRQTLEAGHNIGLAVDGPKGPFGMIHSGVFQLAAMTGATIVPLLPAVKPRWVAGTWDRTVVPYLFSKIDVQVGPLLNVSAGANSQEIESLRHQLDEFFQSQDRSVA